MKMLLLKSGVVLMAALALTVQAAEKLPDAEAEVSVAIEEGVPGGVFVNTVQITAKVVAINYETREVELLLPGGVTEMVEVGPEAVNFDQVKEGDMVKAVVTEALVIGMGAPDAELGTEGQVTIMAAAPGEQPGAIAADTVRETAEVVALDGLNRTATLRFEDGHVETVTVRDDIDLTKYHLGEKVVFQITQMVALSVEKQ
jgi:hypothetical protein